MKTRLVEKSNGLFELYMDMSSCSISVTIGSKSHCMDIQTEIEKDIGNIFCSLKQSFEKHVSVVGVITQKDLDYYFDNID